MYKTWKFDGDLERPGAIEMVLMAEGEGRATGDQIRWKRNLDLGLQRKSVKLTRTGLWRGLNKQVGVERLLK